MFRLQIQTKEVTETLFVAWYDLLNVISIVWFAQTKKNQTKAESLWGPTRTHTGGQRAKLWGNQCTEIWVLTRTCTNRCPSGSSATLPPASAPLPRFPYRGGVCSRGKCKTSRAPARTERPTPTACSGSIAPSSFPSSRVFARLRTPAACTSTQMQINSNLCSPSAAKSPSHPADRGWSMNGGVFFFFCVR